MPTPNVFAGSKDGTLALLRGTATAVLAALILGLLYFGRDIFVPIALAVLLSFALAPLTRLLQRFYLPRAVAVVVVVMMAFAVIFSIGGLIATQMSDLATELPRYQSNISAKISAVRGTASGSTTLERAADVLTDLRKEIEGTREQSPRGLSAPRADTKPIPVEVRQPTPGALESLAALISPLLHPLTTTGIVVIFVVFTLMQREDLRNRLIKLAGSHDLQKTTLALDDAATRIGKLFLSQLALNAAFGLTIGVGLWTIGIPSAPLWGVLAGVLRFVPYIGAIISAVFPLMLAVAVDPGWTLLIWTGVLFAVAEPLAGHIIEPWLYGRSTGLSPLAVVISATICGMTSFPPFAIAAMPATIWMGVVATSCPIGIWVIEILLQRCGA